MSNITKIKTTASLALKFSAFAVSSAFFLGNVYLEVGRFLKSGYIEPAGLTLFLGCMVSAGWMVYDEVAVRVREKRLLDIIDHNCNPNYVVKDIANLDRGNILVTYENIGTGHVYKRQLSL